MQVPEGFLSDSRLMLSYFRILGFLEFRIEPSAAKPHFSSTVESRWYAA